MEIKINCSYELEDVIELSLFSMRYMIWIVSLVGTILMMIYAINQSFTVPIICFVSILAGITCYFLARELVKRQGKKSFDTSELMKITHLKIAREDGIEEITEFSTGTLSYDKFYKVIEVPNAFYLLISAKQAMMLRKKDFESPDNVSEFRNILSSKIPASKLKLIKNDI